MSAYEIDLDELLGEAEGMAEGERLLRYKLAIHIAGSLRALSECVGDQSFDVNVETVTGHLDVRVMDKEEAWRSRP